MMEALQGLVNCPCLLPPSLYSHSVQLLRWALLGIHWRHLTLTPVTQGCPVTPQDLQSVCRVDIPPCTDLQRMNGQAGTLALGRASCTASWITALDL